MESYENSHCRYFSTRFIWIYVLISSAKGLLIIKHRVFPSEIFSWLIWHLFVTRTLLYRCCIVLAYFEGGWVMPKTSSEIPTITDAHRETRCWRISSIRFDYGWSGAGRSNSRSSASWNSSIQRGCFYQSRSLNYPLDCWGSDAVLWQIKHYIMLHT